MGTRRLLSIALFIGLSVGCLAQRTVRVCAEYIYHAPENITVEQAKLVALDRAKIQAIADEFGTLVSQSNTTFIRTENGNSVVDFQSIGGSDVKGEWIETIGEPKYQIDYEENHLVVTVTVNGKIREITASQIDLIAQVLCNGTTEQCERSEFKDGDDLYLRFQSPVDGYLTVYLVDAVAQTAYCLLPYRASDEVACRIRRDTPYVFFSKSNAPAKERNDVDEYVMTCSVGQERNDLYIIFSPNTFVKANSESVEELRPRQLEWTDFQKWLAKGRGRDKEMRVVAKTIMIKE
ncbi:DUF4384 domain-containing protein [Bacteroides sp. AN502(2024)]|uniref:DUF4384 domain-containing protein n=1 Tax=Bacteroides sp. AN502(2024) TaxID=3160599 RepID=UPI0035174AE7